MNIQQLRAVRETVRRGYNLTEAAVALNSSQPVLSRQVQALEEQLGVDLFFRSGKRLVSLTEVGERLLPLIERVLRDIDGIRSMALEQQVSHVGRLAIAATHAHARYMLPAVLKDFRLRCPDVALHIRQGSASQVVDMLAKGEVDIGIATDTLSRVPQLACLPCYSHTDMILVTPGHPLLDVQGQVTLEQLSHHPLVSYQSGSKGREYVDSAFERVGLTPNVVLDAVTADVIKTYVELGMGVGIAASIAWDDDRDPHHLCRIDAGHLFPLSTTCLAWTRGHRLSGAAITFIETFAPTLTPEVIRQAQQG